MDRIDKAMVFNSLADETRQRIVELLRIHGETCQNSLVEATGCPQPSISKHITILRYAKVVTVRKDGNRCYYRLNDEVIVELRRYVSKLQVPTPA